MNFKSLLLNFTGAILLVLTFGLTAQAQIIDHSSFPKNREVNLKEIKSQVRAYEDPATEINASFLIDYDSVANNTNSFFWVLNNDFTGNFDLNYAIVAFDSLVDRGGTGYDNGAHYVTVDSVLLFISHVNASNQNDTVVISIVELDADDRPTENVLFSSGLISDTSLSSSITEFFPILIRPNVTLCEGSFGVRVDFFGPTSDSLGVLASFKKDCNNAATCPGATRSPFFPNSYQFIHVTSINPPIIGELPDISGNFGFGFDCNASGAIDVGPGFCEDWVIQEFLFFPFVTINDTIRTSFAVTDETCPGDDDGGIVTTVAGGSGPYSYVWNNGGNTQNLSGLPAGNYNVQISDSNNCFHASMDVEVAPADTIKGDVTTTPDDGTGSGTATIDVSNPEPGETYTVTMSTGPSGAAPLNVTGLDAGSYTATITNSKGCSVTVNVIIGVNTAIDKEALGIQQFDLYPNPSTGVFTLTLSLEERDNLNIQILDIKGQVINTQQVQGRDRMEQSFDLSAQSAGVYLLKLTTSKGSYTRKLMLK